MEGLVLGSCSVLDLVGRWVVVKRGVGGWIGVDGVRRGGKGEG